jgi:hypothetical protein
LHFVFVSALAVGYAYSIFGRYLFCYSQWIEMDTPNYYQLF